MTEDSNPTGGPEAPKNEGDWEADTWKEVRAGFNQIENALKKAYRNRKGDPKLKKLQEDVRGSFDQVSKDISNLFKEEHTPKA